MAVCCACYVAAHHWLRKADVDDDVPARVTTTATEELQALTRRNRLLDQEEILCRSAAFNASLRP